MKRALIFYLKKNSSPVLNKDILNLAMSLMLILFISSFSGHKAYAQSNEDNLTANVSISEGADWKYMKGTQPPHRYWKDNGYDDSSWLSGKTALGYGRSNIKTHLGDMQGSYSALYARKTFNVNNIYTVTGMNLSVACDGPFIAYINGIEVIRNSSSSAPAETLNISGFIHELFPRENVLSIECNNDHINSSDFSFIPSFEVLEDQGGTIQ